jgi:hypothetical protein
MKQHEAVIQAMQENGGYATLGHLYRTATRIPGSRWGTKTPFASVRRIVQEHPAFFKIKPGLWALESEREQIARRLALTEDAPESKAKAEEFSHSYYQGLIVEIGNLESYETFIPSQDKNKRFLARKLSEVASLPKFYEFTYEHLLRRGRTVDVTWFNERKLPNSFFEVEHSTDIQNSLLKFVEFQDFKIRFFIVADRARLGEFKSKLAYNAFAPIRSEVNFIDYESLSDLHSKVSARVAARQTANL